MLKRIVRDHLGGSPPETQYLDLIRDILGSGSWVEGRNGRTKCVFGAVMHFDLSDGTVPVLTTKRVAWKTCLKELLWFVSGSTDNRLLRAQNVKIWNDNASREFLDSRGLSHLKEDDLGPVYGHQWRHFGAEYSDCDADYTGQGIDQLANVVNGLRDPAKRYSRRLVVSAWNPSQLDEMALPPCHILMQFNVIDDKLSCSLYQRSGDVGLGVPFNIASYSFLLRMVADTCGLAPGDFVYTIGNAHIYEEHIDALAEQVELAPFPSPALVIKEKKRDSLDEFELGDFSLENYECHGRVPMVMKA
jgi:thymidylate synthase